MRVTVERICEIEADNEIQALVKADRYEVTNCTDTALLDWAVLSLSSDESEE
jgi:hypothetical protein